MNEDGGRLPNSRKPEEKTAFQQGADSSGYADRYEKQTAFRTDKTGAEPGEAKKKRQKPYQRPDSEHPDIREPTPERHPDSPLRFEEAEDPKAVTSGQNVPKSKKPHAKFHEYSEKARPSDKLRDAPAVDNKAARNKKKLNQSKLRMEKTGGKLEKAQKKKAKQKPYKKQGVVSSVRHAAQFEAYRQIHGKIHNAEQENAGVEAAHKSELVGERVAGKTKRFIQNRNRTRPARRVQKWTKRDIKAKTNFQYKKMVQDNPALKKNAISRYLQKRRLKKRYQKQAKEAAKKGAKAAKKTAVTTGKIVGGILKFAVSNPKVLIILLIATLLVVILYSCVGTVTMVGNGVTGAVGAATYLAEDADIDMAELAYTEWETDLQLEINNIETTQPGYDEYRYNVGRIGHDPYELMAFLTAVYQNFTYTGVESVLREIFDEQYTLTTREITEEVETEDEDGETVTEEKKILEITLTVQPFSDLLYSRMTQDQQEHFNVLVMTKGNRQYWHSPFPVWLPHVSSNYGYRVHPIRGDKDYHMGIDIALPEGTVILSAQAGTVMFADNNGDYGLVVVIDDGAGLVSKYAHCSRLLVSTGQTVEPGTPIAEVGTTGSSTGDHLHMELIKDGKYLNPLYFALTGDFIMQ